MRKTEEIAKEISELLPTFLRHMYPHVFNPMPIPPSQVIACVSIQERKGCTLTDLKNEMHVSAPTVSGIVNRLERDGFLIRCRNKEDRRVVNVQLTSKGLQLVKTFRGNIKKRWEYILTKMPNEMAETQIKIMRRLVEGFLDGTI